MLGVGYRETVFQVYTVAAKSVKKSPSRSYVLIRGYSVGSDQVSCKVWSEFVMNRYARLGEHLPGSVLALHL